MPQYGVSCRTCAKTIWEGDDQPDNGQTIATEWADRRCRRKDCPHTTDAIRAAHRHRPVTFADLEPILDRLAALEGNR